MRWMRWPLITLIVLLIPVWLLLLIPQINGFGPESIKHELQSRNAYQQLSTLLHQADNQPQTGQAVVEDQALIILRSALTKDYIKDKVNQFIDDSDAWLNNRTQTPPALDLNDIKTQVLTAYPDAQLQIDELKQNLAQAKQELKDNPMPVDGIEGLESDGSASGIEIAKLLQQADSLNNFIEGDFKINLETSLRPIYNAYQIYKSGLIVLGVIILLLVIGFIFTHQGWSARFKNTGWLLIAVATVNGVLSIIFSVAILKIGLDIIVGMIPSQAEAAGSIGQAIAAALFTDYIRLELIISGVLLLIGVILIVATKIISNKQRPPANLIKSTPEPQSPPRVDASKSINSELANHKATT